MEIYLCRHGQTEWTQSGQHTGATDIPLNKAGELQAAQMAPFLKKIPFAKTFTSPRLRALQTSKLAGFHAEIDPDLAEWDYGDFEGLTSIEIKTIAPHWNLFVDGAPGGESLKQMSDRADRVLKKYKTGPIAIFSHGHFSRVLTTRYLGLPISAAALFNLSPASISHLKDKQIQFWNFNPSSFILS